LTKTQKLLEKHT